MCKRFESQIERWRRERGCFLKQALPTGKRRRGKAGKWGSKHKYHRMPCSCRCGPHHSSDLDRSIMMRNPQGLFLLTMVLPFGVHWRCLVPHVRAWDLLCGHAVYGTGQPVLIALTKRWVRFGEQPKLCSQSSRCGSLEYQVGPTLDVWIRIVG